MFFLVRMGKFNRSLKKRTPQVSPAGFLPNSNYGTCQRCPGTLREVGNSYPVVFLSAIESRRLETTYLAATYPFLAARLLYGSNWQPFGLPNVLSALAPLYSKDKNSLVIHCIKEKSCSLRCKFLRSRSAIASCLCI